MNFILKKFIGRERELATIRKFIAKKGSGLIHVRGRRRIGKSWLLKKVCGEYSNSFYFQGKKDASNINQMSLFIEDWDLFTGEKRLSSMKKSSLNWSLIFKEIDSYSMKSRVPLLIVFDEIQWMAKKGVGFVSLLKESWINWEASDAIKLIISGSSNKFFEAGNSAETKIMRGLRTHSDICVNSFSLQELKSYFFSKWSNEEICLIYMFTGGVPYYLDRINRNVGFVRAVNSAFFTGETIFFDELDEILDLEFNEKSKSNVVKILSCLGQDGRTLAQIQKVSGINEATIRGIINKLLDYKLVYSKVKMGRKEKSNSAGVKYLMKDFFLNFYFQVLVNLRDIVLKNTRQNIFKLKCLQTTDGYYIPNFSGKAFELLVENVLDRCRETGEISQLVEKLGFSHGNYTIGYYWEDGKTEIDRIVESKDDRESCVVEMKWVKNKACRTSDYLEEILRKEYIPPKRFQLVFCLVISSGWTTSFCDKAQEEGVLLVDLADLF